MKKLPRQLVRPSVLSGTVVATERGWLHLKSDKDVVGELITSNRGLFSNLKALDALESCDLTFAGLSVPATKEEASQEPVVEALTPLQDLVEFSEEVLSKYEEGDLIEFCKENDLGNPRKKETAIKAILDYANS